MGTIRRLIGVVRSELKLITLRGSNVQCVVCDRGFRRFLEFNGRENVMCPNCGSLERHRLAWLLLRDELKVAEEPVRLLHFAPEPCLRNRIRELHHVRYVTADLLEPDVDIQLDISAMHSEKDASYDRIICSHVLEHVDNDEQALAEMFRVLVPGGRGLLGVPVDPSLRDTYEDASITAPEERDQHFGQWDHVRFYSPGDFMRRVLECGFEAEVVDSRHYDQTGVYRLEREVTRVGADLIVIARRPA